MRRAVAVCCGALLVGSAALVEAQATSSQQNPVHSFNTPGQHQVTLTVCSPNGCDSEMQNVTVLDPMPSILSSLVGVATAEAGQLVSLSGSGKGKPPLTYSWRVLLGPTLVKQVAGATGWLDTTGLSPGIYAVLLRITNASGQADSLPAVLTLAPAQTSDFHTVPPCRLVDTRTGSPLQSGTTRLLGAGGACGIPAGARALAANITVVSPTASGTVALFPGNYPAPGTSTINYLPGATRSNNAILPLSTDGDATLAALATLQGGGAVHLLVDVTGYFAP
ncbi:MAG TPA: hypothetical protein VN493_06730 [Thermoanaerobaculia bacterium]|nr:hypothetical protein [Thermoanaerobaculia bacterium]